MNTPRITEQVPGARPYLIESAPASETVFSGHRCLYFGGTSYFGLHADNNLMQAGIEAWHTLGHGTATSRAGMGTASIYLQLEQAAADFLGTEAAAYLPSGYLSNLAGLKALRLTRSFDVIFIDEHAHYSAFDAARSVGVPVHTVVSRDAGDLEQKLREILGPAQVPLMISDGIFPTLGQIAPAPDFSIVLEAYGGLLWLDDSHALGILGASGRGVYDHFGISGPRLMSGGTLAKAFGGFGGIIPGTRDYVSQVMVDEVMAGASAVPPPLAAATLEGIRQVSKNPQWREQLVKNARLLKSGIRSLGFEIEENDVPIAAFSLGDGDSMAHIKHTLMRRGIAIQHAHYSGVGDEGVLRMVVFSTHSEQQIQRLIGELKELV